MKFLTILSAMALTGVVYAQSTSLQDLSKATEPLPKAVIYIAKKIVTLDPAKPKAEAVAVVGDRILATGSLEELKKAAGEQPYRIDETFMDKVVVPGLIGQHDHPFLTALTMVTEIIAIEDWTLPSGVVKAANNREEYISRLKTAEESLKDPKELLISWGFHHYFHGKLTRQDLNKISKDRPILVWHRSCHEFILNDAALKFTGIDAEHMKTLSESAQEQSNLAEGHFGSKA